MKGEREIKFKIENEGGGGRQASASAFFIQDGSQAVNHDLFTTAVTTKFEFGQ